MYRPCIQTIVEEMGKLFEGQRTSAKASVPTAN